MPRSFSVTALLARIRQVTDTENDTSITDSFLQTHLSTIYGQAWGIVCDTGLDYFQTRTNLVSAGGGSNILAEPADLLYLKGIHYVEPPGPPTGRRHPLEEAMFQELEGIAQPETTGPWARYYEHVGAQFLLYPTPPAAGQIYQTFYIPQPPDLTAVAGNTLVNVVTSDGEAFLTYGVGALVLERKKWDPKPLLDLQSAAEARLAAWAGQRAFHQPRRQIVRVDDDEPIRPGDWRMARP